MRLLLQLTRPGYVDCGCMLECPEIYGREDAYQGNSVHYVFLASASEEGRSRFPRHSSRTGRETEAIRGNTRTEGGSRRELVT
jgi:hypothetical protein